MARVVASLGLAALLALPLPSGAAAGEQPVTFQTTEMGATTDPTGLWTDAEVAEGGSSVQPSIHYATVPVDGGTLTLARLVDQWCGMQDCPIRFRIETDAGQVYQSHAAGDYDMACGSDQGYAVDPVELVLTACGHRIDLKTAR